MKKNELKKSLKLTKIVNNELSKSDLGKLKGGYTSECANDCYCGGDGKHGSSGTISHGDKGTVAQF